MRKQGDLFDRAEGTRLRDQAIAQVDMNAEDYWKQCAHASILMVARERTTLTTDHVWDCLGKLHPHAATHERRAMGPRMTAAAKLEVIKPSESPTHILSERPACHRRPLRLWISCLRNTP